MFVAQGRSTPLVTQYVFCGRNAFQNTFIYAHPLLNLGNTYVDLVIQRPWKSVL